MDHGLSYAEGRSAASLLFGSRNSRVWRPLPKRDGDGNLCWYNRQGQLHRSDGPAIERVSGAEEWFFNGSRHRADGPAVIHVTGTREWWQDGHLYREDGPAIEYAHSFKQH